jgi:GT2 family glycosyltransferase
MIDRARPHLDITVIVVNWNTKDLLHHCLASVFRSLRRLLFQVIVVDNASQDGSANMVNELFPEAMLVKNEENVGFARANNQAFKLVGNSKYVLILNSDTILPDETIKTMLDFMETNTRAGLVAPVLRFPDGRFQLGGGFGPSLRTAFNYFFFLSFFFPSRHRGMFIGQRKPQLQEKAIRMDWVAGACMLVRKEVIDSTGGFDESYFMYAEDAEWCERIRKAGWSIYYLPYAEIIHYHGASTKEVSARWLKALFAYMTKKTGIPRATLFRLIAASGFWLRSMIYLLSYLITQRKELKERAHHMCLLAKDSLDWRNSLHGGI